MSLKKHLSGIKGEAREIAEEGKKVVYGTVSIIEQKIENKEVIETILDYAGEVIKEGKEMHETIKKGGGYKAAAKRASKPIIDGTKDFLKDMEKRYEDFENQFFTDDKFDPKKAEDFLKDKARVACRFGKRAVDTLCKIVSEGFEAIKKDYRSLVPSKEERETKYVGIGTAYKGVLLREDFDKCLDFHNKTRSKLPSGLKTRKKILNDIKVNAIGGKKDLVEFYKEKSDKERAKVVKEYL